MNNDNFLLHLSIGLFKHIYINRIFRSTISSVADIANVKSRFA